MTNRPFVLLGALAALILAVAAPARAADHVTLVLDWFVNPDHAALVVAKEKGFFAEAGLDVDLVAPADPNDPPKLLAAGKADLAVGYQPQMQMQVAEGLPLVRIATLVSTPLNSLIALDDGHIKSIADLKGRKIGYSVAGFEDALLSTILGRHGLTLKDVTLVNVNFALLPALLSRQVDAVIGGFRNVEAVQMKLEGHKALVFYPEEEGVPPYDELVLLARADTVADPRFGRLIGAVERATLYIHNHPDEAWTLFVSHHKDLDDALNRAAWAATLPRLANDPGAVDLARYETFGRFLIEHKIVKALPPTDRYVRAVPRP